MNGILKNTFCVLFNVFSEEMSLGRGESCLGMTYLNNNKKKNKCKQTPNQKKSLSKCVCKS